MKKIIPVILASIMILTLFAACTDATAGTTQTPSNQSAQAPAGNAPAANAPASGNAAPASGNTAPASGNAAPVSNFDTSRIIAVLTREDGSGTRDAFINTTGVGSDMYAEAIVFNETNQILTNVETNEYAIGYVSVGSLSDKVKALTVDGVAPSDATIKDGSYTVQRPLLVCVNAEKAETELVKDFISFMLSAQGQEISGTKWTMINANAPTYTPRGLNGTLKVGGSTSVEPLMQALRQAYIALNPGVELEISGGGSGTGISEATSGVLDIGMSSRALRDTEKENLTGTDIALDGVAIIVNPNNPVTNMSIEQIKDIFTGAVTRWSGVG